MFLDTSLVSQAQATFFSGLSPSAAVDVQRSLDMACKDLVTNTDLHALYLVTPIDGLEPDWGAFRDVYTGWGDEDPARIVGKAVRLRVYVHMLWMVRFGGSTAKMCIRQSLLIEEVSFTRAELNYPDREFSHHVAKNISP